MSLILASECSAIGSAEVVERMRQAAARPRIAWVASPTTWARAAAAEVTARLQAHGFDPPEYCDVDEDADQVQLAYLHEFDVICVCGEDAVRYRYNMMRTGLGGRLRRCAASGRLIVAAGAGSQLFTPTVSLARVMTSPLSEVLAERGRYDALGAVSYEVLPQADRCDAATLEGVRRYAEGAGVDVVALSAGAALLVTDRDTFEAVGGVTRLRAADR